MTFIAIPDLDMDWKSWTDDLLYRCGYGGCDAPHAPLPTWMPAPQEDYNPLELAKEIFAKLPEFEIPTESRNEPDHDDRLTAGLGDGTLIEGLPNATPHIARVRIILNRGILAAYRHHGVFSRLLLVRGSEQHIVKPIVDAVRCAEYLVMIGGTRHITPGEIHFFQRINNRLFY